MVVSLEPDRVSPEAVKLYLRDKGQGWDREPANASPTPAISPAPGAFSLPQPTADGRWGKNGTENRRSWRMPAGALRGPCSTVVPVKVPQRATSVCHEKKLHPYRYGGHLMRRPRGDSPEGSQPS